VEDLVVNQAYGRASAQLSVAYHICKANPIKKRVSLGRDTFQSLEYRAWDLKTPKWVSKMACQIQQLSAGCVRFLGGWEWLFCLFCVGDSTALETDAHAHMPTCASSPIKVLGSSLGILNAPEMTAS
jgi:hypothetical protein